MIYEGKIQSYWRYVCGYGWAPLVERPGTLLCYTSGGKTRSHSFEVALLCLILFDRKWKPIISLAFSCITQAPPSHLAALEEKLLLRSVLTLLSQRRENHNHYIVANKTKTLQPRTTMDFSSSPSGGPSIGAAIPHTSPVTSLSFHADGVHLFAATEADSKLYLINTHSGQCHPPTAFKCEREGISIVSSTWVGVI